MSKAIVGAVEIGAAVGLAAISGGTGGILALAELKGGSFLATAALSIGLAGVSQEAGAIADALVQNRGMSITTRQPASFREIVYGTQRIGGVIVYRSTTGSHHDQYNYVIVLATHQIDAIQNLYLDGRKVYWEPGSAGQAKSSRNGYTFGGSAATSGGIDGEGTYVGPNGQHYNFGTLVYCEARFGDQVDGDVIGGLTANDPNWTATAQGSPWLGGCTYVYLKVEYDAGMFPGEPEIRFTVNGKNDIYDPRTGTSGFSSNWALIVADVITDPVWGLGDNTVNQAQLIAAANVCDQSVTLATQGTEANRACHFHYDTSMSPGDVLNTLMTGNEGRISRVGGQWMIYPPYWMGSSFTFDESALLGPVAWNPYRSVSDLINRVTGTYTAPNYPYNAAGNLYDTNGWYDGTIQNNWPFAFQPTNYPEYACDQLHGYGTGVDVYLTADLGIPHPKELNQPTCLSIAQAQRTAKVCLLRNRQQGSGTLMMNMSAWQMEPGDIMQFTFAPLGWTNKYLEVTEVKLTLGHDENGTPYPYVQVSVQETDPSVYNWATSEELNAYDVESAPGATPYTVDAPTNLTIEDDTTTELIMQDGTTIPRVLVTWTPPNDTYVANGGAIEVQYQLSTAAFDPQPVLLNPVLDVSTHVYTSQWIDVGKFPGISTGCFINGISQGQYQFITVQVRAVRSGGATSPWVAVGVHPFSTTGPSIPATAVEFTSTGTTLDTLEPVSAAQASIVLSATGQQTNLIPDSDLKFGSAYWTMNAALPIVNGVGANGGNAFAYTGNGGAAGFPYNASAVIPVVPGETYTLSGYIDATAVTSGAPGFLAEQVSFQSEYADVQATAGKAGLLSVTFQVPSGVTELRILCDMLNATVTNGGKVYFSTPQLEHGSVATSYKSNSADSTTGSYVHGAMSSEVQSAIAAGSGHVQNLGGVAASSITPISSLMPSQAGADVTSQSGLVTVLNPTFQRGATDWSVPAGWSVISGYQPQTGSNYYAQYTGSSISAIVNNAQITCQAGDVISATAMAWYGAAPNSNACVRVNFYEASGTLLQTVNGSGLYGSPLNTIIFSRCTATAPAATSYCTFDFAVFTSASAIVNLYSLTANLNLRSLDELPDGTTYQRPLYISNGVYKTSSGLLQQGSLVNLSEGGDGSILSSSVNNSSIIMSWVSFYIFAPDGNTYTCPSGSHTFSGLAANTKYYFSAWYNVASNALTIATTGTSPSTQQYQVQTVQADGNVGVCIDFYTTTSGSAGYGGGVGGGGGGATCFSPNTLVLVQREGQELSVPIVDVHPGDLVRTLTGAWRRVFYVTAVQYCGPMQIIPGVGLSTPTHQMWDGNAWVDARSLYAGEIPYDGTIHNLHIDTETEDEHSYTLSNGQIVHNLNTTTV